MNKLAYSVCLGASVLMLYGAGCASPISVIKPQESGPKVASFQNVDPQTAARKIHFVPGSSFDIRATFLGFGAKLSAALAGQKKEGTRVVVIDRFAPMETANLSWKLSTKVEAESSKKARAEAQRLKKTMPEPVMVDQTATGMLKGVNLKDAHMLMLPGYWPEKDDASSQGTSGIWLSREVFEGLERNRIATLDFGLLDTNIQGAVAAVGDFKNVFSALGKESDKIGNRVDVFKLEGEQNPSEWKLKVNGQEVTAQVLKAHTWFGDLVVLDNPQNPLILKATLNPVASELASNLDSLKALLGYEVVALDGVQE